MADDFDRWLTAALAPAERDPDRAFTARVKALALLDAQYRAAVSATRRRMALETLALGATGIGAVMLARLPQFATGISEYPAGGVAALVAGFALLVLLLPRDGGRRAAAGR